MFRRALILVGVAMYVAAPETASAAPKLKSKGELRFESRFFSDDGTPLTEDQGLGLFGRLEASLRHKPFKEKIRIYGRLDSRDPGRTILIAEELWIRFKKWGLEVRVGADIVNWTATEAFHPADIINARNIDSDAERLEKIGEPMVKVGYKLGTGSVSGYFMPYYSTPILPSRASRLAFIPPTVEVGPTLRLEQDGTYSENDFGLQGAVRLTQSFGGADVGVHVVHHMDRSQPEVVFDPELQLPRALFRKVTQFGGTYQQVIDALLVKVEAAYRVFATPDEMTFGMLPDRDHFVGAVGLEYGFLHDDTGVESTFLLEAQSIFLVDEAVRRSLQIFQRDALAGWRIALNDEASSEVLISAIVDLEDPEQVLVNASFTRRMFDEWQISAALRFAFAPDVDPRIQQQFGGFTVPDASDHFRIFISRFF